VWRRLAAPLVALVVGGLVGAWIGASAADPRSDTEKSIDALEAADIQRDAEQVVSLTDQARRVRGMLGPALDGLRAALPAGGAAAGPVASAATVAGWKGTTGKAVQEFADPPSGGTAVNIARSSLAAGVRQLDLAVDSYAEAVRATDNRRSVQLALASRQRDTALTTWSIGATQLDLLNIETGHGHQHVFLPTAPGEGSMTADGSKEGN
jgi:hypothetical protein